MLGLQSVKSYMSSINLLLHVVLTKQQNSQS